MLYWSEKQASTLSAVTSYTDGGKMQIEQVLIANGLGAGIARTGMIGGAVDDLLDLGYLAAEAERIGRPVSDYIVHPKGPKGVLVLATSEDAERTPDYSVFSKVRTRDGRAYMLLKPHYFVHVEVPKTLRGVVAGAPPVITNGLAPDRLDRRRRQARACRRHPDRCRARRLRAARRGGDHRRASRTRCRSRCSTARCCATGSRPAPSSPRPTSTCPTRLARRLWLRTAARVPKGSHAA